MTTTLDISTVDILPHDSNQKLIKRTTSGSVFICFIYFYHFFRSYQNNI